MDILKKEIQNPNKYSEKVKEEYCKMECEISVREEHFIHPSTMFLTNAEAKQHIELNHYHYSERVYTYAMSAWCAPKVERLLQI